MSCVKNPGAKKQLSLLKDHRVFAHEGNKSFRSAWRLKKTKTTRRARRALKVALTDPALIDSDGVKERVAVKPKRSLKKHGVMSLAQSISVKNDKPGLRWNLRVLNKNPGALNAKISRGKTKRSSG